MQMVIPARDVAGFYIFAPLFPRLTKKKHARITKQHHKSDPRGFSASRGTGFLLRLGLAS
jgi:hypothetical protein